MITVNAMGDACPIPVVKTLNTIKTLTGAETIEVLVDNEIAVQNVTKMAKQKNFSVKSEKLGEGQYRIEIAANGAEISSTDASEEAVCTPDLRKKNVVAVISSPYMGTGDDELGAALMKSFIFALSQQEELPSTILLYNGGAKLACEEAPTLEDLKSMEAQGVEILTCGTCLNHYGLAEKLAVGGVTNMYVIVEKMTQASLIVKP